MTLAHFVTVTTHSEKETLEWAKDFAKTLGKGSVVALYGTLGAERPS